MTEDQANEIIEGQKAILEGINKLLALFTLEPLNDATNPILNLGQAAKLLGTTSSQLSKACEKNEVPYRRLGSKYIFSRVALMAWLHNVNMCYLFEKAERYKKAYQERGFFYKKEEDPLSLLENWIRFTVNPVLGAREEFRLKYDESEEVPETLDAKEAAELMGVPEWKAREWAYAFLYHKTPVTRTGNKFLFPKNELIEWMKTPVFHKLKEDYIATSTLYAERRKAAEARREAERLAKEERKRLRLEKKMNKK